MKAVPKFRRNRKKLSCTNCRERKKKCDRGSPCSLCTRNHFADTCRYDATRGSRNFLENSTKPLEQDKSPQVSAALQPVQTDSPPISPSGDIDLPNSMKMYLFNVHQALNPSGSSNFRWGVLPHVSMPELDPASSTLLRILRSRDRAFWTELRKPRITPAWAMALESASRKEYGENSIFALLPECSTAQLLAARAEISSIGASSGIFFSGPDWVDLSLMDQIRATIPSYNVVQQYVDFFFEQLYIFPVLYEATFRESVHNILHNYIPEKPDTLVVELPDQLVTIMSLILVFRLVYLAVLRLPPSSSNYAILQHPISLHSISLVENLRKELNYANDASWELVQALLLLYLYRFQAPETDSHDGRNLDLLLSEIIVMSRLLKFGTVGINPPPLDKPGLQRAEFKLGLWHTLIMLSLEMVIIYDRPLLISSDEFDSSIPKWNPNNSRRLNETWAAYSSVTQVTHMMHVLHEKIIIGKNSLPLGETFKMLSEFESYLESNLGDSNDYLIRLSNASLAKCLKFRCLLSAKCMLFVVYYALGLLFEANEKYDICYICLKKQIMIAYSDFGWLQKNFVDSSDKLIGTTSFPFLVPILIGCNRTQSVLIKLGMRATYSLRMFQKSDDSLNSLRLRKALETILKEVNSIERKMLNFIEYLSTFHRGSFLQADAYKFGYEVIRGDFLGPEDPDFLAELVFRYPPKMLEDLKKLLIVSVSEVELLGEHMAPGTSKEFDAPLENERPEFIAHLWHLAKMWEVKDRIDSLIKDSSFRKRIHSGNPDVKLDFEIAHVKSDNIENTYSFLYEAFDENLFSAGY